MSTNQRLSTMDSFNGGTGSGILILVLFCILLSSDAFSSNSAIKTLPFYLENHQRECSVLTTTSLGWSRRRKKQVTVENDPDSVSGVSVRDPEVLIGNNDVVKPKNGKTQDGVSHSHHSRLNLVNGAAISKEKKGTDDNDDEEIDSHATFTTSISRISSAEAVRTEINRIIVEGFDELWTRNQNITLTIEEAVDSYFNSPSPFNLSSSSSPSLVSSSLSNYDLAGGSYNGVGLEWLESKMKELQEDQKKQLTDMQRKAERTVVNLLSDLALYSDTTTTTILGGDGDTSNSAARTRRRLLPRARRIDRDGLAKLKTRELMKYWKVAPLYYTVALLLRWVKKAPGPRTTWLNLTRAVSRLVGRRVASRNVKEEKNVYDAEAMVSGWRRTGEIASKGPLRRQVEILRRSVEIWGYFTTFYLREKRMVNKYRKGRWSSEQLSAGRSALGREVTQNLLKLGPTFIKVGQLFSTRIDVVPKEYVEELRTLQDNVPPFSGDLAVQIVEEELGAKVTELFHTFEKKSLAAASLGQVHVATVIDRKTGAEQKLAIKVQRRHLRELFEIDLGQLRQLAGFADALDFKGEGGVMDRNTQRDWLSVYGEMKRLLYEEIDYVNELRNCDDFRNNFVGSPLGVKVPRTYPEFSTDKVLAMEYLPGIKVSDRDTLLKSGIDPVDVGTRSAQAFLEQLCRHGFFHCDPHPGNVAVDANNGDLIYYDFGMMEKFDELTRKALVDFLFAFYIDDDVREVCDALERLGILRTGGDVDRVAVERVGRDFMDRFQDTLTEQDGQWDDQLSQEERTARRRERRRRLGEEFLSLNSDVPFVFPPTWTFVFRAFLSLDGIGKTLVNGSPPSTSSSSSRQQQQQYDMTRIAQPYILELLDLKGDGSALLTALGRLGKRVGLRPKDIGQLVTLPRRTAAVQDTIQRLEQGEIKLRVRALEVERAVERSALVQSHVVGPAVLSTLVSVVHLGTLLLWDASPAGVGVSRARAVASRLLLALSAVCAFRIPVGVLKLRKLDQYRRDYGLKK